MTTRQQLHYSGELGRAVQVRHGLIEHSLPTCLLLIALAAPRLMAEESEPRFALVNAQMKSQSAPAPTSAGRFSATARIEARQASGASARFSLSTQSAAGCETASGLLFADGFE